MTAAFNHTRTYSAKKVAPINDPKSAEKQVNVGDRGMFSELNLEHKYCIKHSSDQPKVISEVFENTYSSVHGARMMISSIQGQTLSMLISLLKPKICLELGCFVGNSALWIADGLAKAFPRPHKKQAAGHLWTCEIDPKTAELATSNISKSDLAEYVTVVNSSGLDFLAKWDKTKQFDFVFIDADKGNYINYYEYIVSNNLLAPNGLIIADNVLFKGQVSKLEATTHYANPSSVSQKIFNFNLHVKNDPRTEQVVLPVFDGMSLISLKK
ncbi:putative O-methyltransferase YrrM [Smittium culicis]|uniref:Putative O-methyltransferase YrrM n=1 Tax=Smittium culicis TaxID=133412 RepID=A0A1R1XG88_9FUNG|nr:putative O-methyltransferase YrrM [Smittium culicis]